MKHKIHNRLVAILLSLLVAVGTAPLALAYDDAPDDVAQVSVDTSHISLDSSQVLLEGLVAEIMYPGQPILYGQVGLESSGLTESQKELYRVLKATFEDVAKNGGSTEFEFSSGIFVQIPNPIPDFDQSNPDHVDDLMAQAETELKEVFYALLADCPYDLYWYDKAGGYSWVLGGYRSDGAVMITKLKFSVVSAYQDNGNVYAVDAAQAQRAETARAKALDIMRKYADKTDSEKLRGYMDEILALTDYNHDTSGITYGDPWQLIYVFDEDPDTKVVCEGYAKAFQYLCEMTEFDSDITCYSVWGEMGTVQDTGSGTITTGPGGHMWNIVRIEDPVSGEGRNYLVDLTNCDTGSVGAPDKLFMANEYITNAGTYQDTYTAEFDQDSNHVKVDYIYDSDQPDLFGREILTLTDVTYRSLTGSGSISGVYQVGQTLTASVSGTPAGITPTVLWYADGAYVAAGSSLTLTAEHMGKTITAMMYDADRTYETCIALTGSGTVGKGDQTVPAAPTVAEKDATSITLQTVAGQEYACVPKGQTPGENNWQTSGVFTGLSPYTAYELYARMAATETLNASPASVATEVYTYALVSELEVGVDVPVRGESFGNAYWIDHGLPAGVASIEASVEWYIGQQLVDPATEKVQGSTVYTAKITVLLNGTEDAERSACFANDVAVQFNGASVPAASLVVNGRQLTITYTFPATEDAPYTVTVTGGSGGGTYQAGESVTLTADAAPEGQHFARWNVTGGSLELTDATAKEITFLMPAGDVTLEAVFEDHTYEDDGDCTTAVICPVCGEVLKAAQTHSIGNAASNGDGTHARACENQGCTYKETEDCSGGTESYFQRPVCSQCGGAYGNLKADTTAPTGTVTVGTNEWKEFLHNITFGLLFRNTKELSITAQDDSYSDPYYDAAEDVAEILYIIAREPMSLDQVKNYQNWTAYEKPVSLSEEGQYVIYAKITDHAGNEFYLSSDGFQLDPDGSAITGISDGGTYCQAVTVTVTAPDAVAKITVDGVEVTPDASYQFTIGSKAAKQTVVVTYIGGDSNTYIITVNNGHTWGAYASNHDATCTEDGTETAECQFCDATDIRTDAGSKLGHDLVHHEGQAATCTEDGWKAYDTCTRCDYTTYEAISATGHAWGQPVWDWSEDGTTAEAVFTCGNDAAHMQRETAQMTPEVITAATCTAGGETRYIAQAIFNGQEYTDTKTVTVPATGHDWDEPTWEWAEDARRVKVQLVCKNDPSHVYLEDTFTYYEGETKLPTCTDEGEERYTAIITLDGKEYSSSKTLPLPPTGHNWDPWAHWDWRMDGQGVVVEISCLNDRNHTHIETPQVTYKVLTEPTCTTNGKFLSSASFDFGGRTYERTYDNIIPATGHAWGQPTWNWSEDGTTAEAVFTCGNDASHTQCETAQMTPQVITAATCTTDGETRYTAKVIFDGQEYTDAKTVVVPATGHDWDIWADWNWQMDGQGVTVEIACRNDPSHIHTETPQVTYKVLTEPTCTADGKFLSSASFDFAGRTYEHTYDNIIPATGHDWDIWADWDWQMDGQGVTVEIACRNDPSHIHTETPQVTYKVLTGPTCTADGKFLSSASFDFAGRTYEHTYDNTIPATGHGDLELRNAKAPTCAAEGYSGDGYCTVCGQMTEQGKALPKTDHTYQDGKCTACGAADPDYQPAVPDTGDSSHLTLWAVLALFTGGMLGALAYGRRKKTK